MGINMSRFVIRFAFLFLLFAANGIVLSAQNDDGIRKSKKTEVVDGRKYYVHTVEKGQTLYAIAKAYDLTVNDVLVENPDALNGIKPGQTLRIPFEKKSAVKPVEVTKDTSKFVIHKVEAGQTLYSLAKKYNVTEQSILDMNPEAKSGLKAGMELKIPVKNTAAVAIIPVNPDTVIAKPDSAFVASKKDVYNIAFMMPLQLWNVNNIEPSDILATPPKGEFPDRPKAAAEFYEGALLAIDSMRKAGMRLNVWVYDVDDIDSGKSAKMLAQPEFKTMDLIIGPFTAGPFEEISAFAKVKNIPIISPVSGVNKVLFKNPTAVKALPSAITQMEFVAQHIHKERKDQNVMMISSGILKESKMAAAFSNEMNRLRTADGKDSIKITKGFSGVEALLKKDVMNVIVVPSNSQAFVTDLLRNLHTLAEKYQITVYGMPQWMEFENLDAEYMQTLNLHFAAPYYVDYKSPITQAFLIRYRNAFGGDPTIYALCGYDVTMFFLRQLFVNGTGFISNLPQIQAEGIQQSFRFVKSDAESGYENTGLRIVHISDYELVPFGVENPVKDKK
jgi:LysM repeat protein/ABC-type branched-subunit amino acid transport system substrate-binding protein